MMILGDWGTTRLRLFRHDAEDAVERLFGPGIGELATTPAEALTATLVPWRNSAVADGLLLCGMAGSRNGLMEAPYAQAASGIHGWAGAASSTSVNGVRVTIAAGLCGNNFAGRIDVMRGEETQLFGALELDAALAAGRQLVVLPGTHSKWAEVADGAIGRFHTFPTGELFSLLCDHSTLTRAGTDTEGRELGFATGLARAGSEVLAHLFEARAAQLIDKRSHGWAVGFLSGLLIGGEIAEALDLLGYTPERVTLIGDPSLLRLYAQAGEARGLVPVTLDGESCAIAGLKRLALERQEAR